MAFKKILLITVSLAAAVHAGYVWQDDDQDIWGYKPFNMRSVYFPPLPVPPPLPPLPPLPNFHFSYIPPLPLPTFPLPEIPMPGEISKIKPAPGQVVSGIAVKTSSGVATDKDGNVVHNGGTTVVTNDNGDVKEIKFGKSPPNINDPIQIPPFPEFKFEPIPPIPPIPLIPPMDFDGIRNYKPGENENFVAYSTSSHSHSSNLNGEKSSGGGSSTIVNVNGAVDEEAVRIGQHDKKKKKKKY